MIKKVQMILLEPKIKYNNWNENFTRKIYQEIENHKKIKINQIEGEKKNEYNLSDQWNTNKLSNILVFETPYKREDNPRDI